MSGIKNIGGSSGYASVGGGGQQNAAPTRRRGNTPPDSSPPQRSSSQPSGGPRSRMPTSNLVAMGEGLKLKTGSASTFGAGPCLAVAVTYSDEGIKRATLTHLQPEADVEAHAAQIAHFMPDRFSADMSVHVASARGASVAERANQKSRTEATVNALANKYDNITFDVGDNVHLHDSDSLKVNADTGSVHTSPVHANFSEAELSDMARHMQANPSKVTYYD